MTPTRSSENNLSVLTHVDADSSLPPFSTHRLYLVLTFAFLALGSFLCVSYDGGKEQTPMQWGGVGEERGRVGLFLRA